MDFLKLWSMVHAFGPFLLVLGAAVGFTLYMIPGLLRQPSGGPLQERYPPAEPDAGMRRTLERVVFGRGPKMTWVRLGVDRRYLHVAFAYGRRGSFSVPLGEITAEPDRFPLMVLAPEMVRLRFARDPERSMMVARLLYERLEAESQGSLRLLPPVPRSRAGV